MKRFLLVGIGVALSSCHIEPAHAIAAPAPQLDAMPREGSRVSPRAHILLRLAKGSAAIMDTLARTMKATIDGKPVATTTATAFVGEYNLLDLQIESDRTGMLTITYEFENSIQSVTYTVAGKATPRIPSGWWWMPRAQVAGTVEAIVANVPHSTVREVYQGVLLTIAQPALSMRVSWRRDSQSDWVTLRLPVFEQYTKKFGVLLGETYRFQFPPVALLNDGVQVRATAELFDGTTVDVVGLPAVVMLPRGDTIPPTP